MKKTSELWDVFRSFFRIGLFTFGGGYAMLPLIESVCVEQCGWITHEQMMQITVIAESTPGPIAINCATYVGSRRVGFWGAVAATLGVVLPSFAIILAISLFFERFLEITVFANALRGVRVAVSLLILRAGLRMVRGMEKKPLLCCLYAMGLTVVLLINLFSWRFSTIWLLLTAGAVSFAACLIRERGRKGGAQ